MSESPSLPRSKRQKLDKHGRGAAFERLKNLKGSKNKYEIKEDIENVYDTVDEQEYAKRILDRQNDDWIDDDDGSGYFEDGRDIFDDDELEPLSTKNKKDTSQTRKRSRVSDNSSGSSSIRNMFSNATIKKKEVSVKLQDDDILSDILGEIDNPDTSKMSKVPSSSKTISKTGFSESENAAAKNFMKSFSSKPVTPKQSPAVTIKSKPSSSNTKEEIVIYTKPQVKKLNQDVQESTSTKSKITQESILKTRKKLQESIPEPTIANDDEMIDMVSENMNTEKTAEILQKDSENNHDFQDIDLAMLDDAENQISITNEIVSKTENIVTKSEDLRKSELVDSMMEEHLLSGWQTIRGNEIDNEQQNIEAKAHEISDISGKSLRIWWWDAWEDPVKRPGEVFLFGRLSTSAESKGQATTLPSCCIRVMNIERVLYLLPREFLLDSDSLKPSEKRVTMMDVYEEFNSKVAPALNLVTYRTRKVTKNYAFAASDVPSSSEYLEVRYESAKPLPDTKVEYLTFSHIFGVHSTPLEEFLLDRKIKGPCWLDVKKAKEVKDKSLSWCTVELACSGPKNITVAAPDKTLSPPTLVLTTLNIRTSLNPKTSLNEVVIISCLVHQTFPVDKAAPNPPFKQHFCGFTRPCNKVWPTDLPSKLSSYTMTRAQKCDSERALLSWFMATFSKTDPDLIVSHDASDCQLELICHRIATLKLPHWSRIGRLRMSSNFGKRIKDWFIGRMICDVKLSAEELIKSRSYDLDTLCVNVLMIKEGERLEISNDQLNTMYDSSDSILKLISLTIQDASYVLRLMCELNVLPLALQITNIAGNLMSRTLQGGRSERNEFLLLHAFTERNYIVPEKRIREWNREGDGNDTTLKSSRKKPAYTGGLVLDPKKGFYDKLILLMDFNSLYPSIIQEYNICFTTVPVPENETDDLVLPDKNAEPGVLPTQIRRLVESRREVKKLMANPDISPDLKMQYNIRQLALKLTANSMYGCLGFTISRFYAPHLAALVTQKGREILTHTQNLVQKLHYDVIYGDTDSIMINTNALDYDEVYKIGSSIKQAVNKIYKQVELDIDGVFRYLLLLKKKKYAAVTITKDKNGEFVLTKEMKGLDIVRRDWSQIAVMAGNVILGEILTDNQTDDRIQNIHTHLEKFRENIEQGAVPLPLLTITKQLTKNPKEYTNTQSLPHVLVALRMNAANTKRFKKGDMVPYIICEDGTESSAMLRSYHIDEYKASDGKLKIDKNYYLAQQIHPVVTRLCEPIEGTDASRIAGCLGLDPAAFKVAVAKRRSERNEEGTGETHQSSNYEKYSLSEKFTFKCCLCKTDNVIASAVRRVDNNLIPSLEKCTNPECPAKPYEFVNQIQNALILSMKNYVRKFYDNWMICDEPSCSRVTRILSHCTALSRPVCLACEKGGLQRQYTETDLYTQLCYFQYVFDLQKHEGKKLRLTEEVENVYTALKETVESVIENSAYRIVNLSKIFSRLFPNAISDLPKSDIDHI